MLPILIVWMHSSFLLNMDIIDCKLKTKYGQDVLDSNYILSLREVDRKNPNRLKIIAQAGGQEKLLSTNADICIYGGQRGGGKALIFDEPICTPFGFRKIQEIKEGDIITGLDGGMQRVIYNSYQGYKECVRLKFVDGSYTDCCIDHLWNIKQSNYCSKKRTMYRLGLNDEWRVWTTKMIIDHMEKQKGKKQPKHLSIPLCSPVRFTRNKPFKSKFNPYIIGALIGDGCITENIINENSCIMLFNPDEEVISEFKNNVEYSSCKFKGGCYHMRINDKELIDEIQKIGIVGSSVEKHIPNMYLYGTLEERWALIQGMMDTDGTIDSRGHLSYTTVSKNLAENVKFIINSLGGLATIRKGRAGYRNSQGEYVRCNDAYNIYIRIPDAERLFKVQRKKDRCKPYNSGISINARRIVGYERIGIKECCCIAVTNPDSLFLTRDFIVTHNSYALLMEALKDVKNPNLRSIVMRHELNDLSDIIETSYQIYTPYGKYNKSKNDMTWNFDRGGFLEFSYHADSVEDFKTRFQGHQYSYIGVDEITHMDYPKFKYMITCNRNAFGLINRFIGTCNPDPDSWVARFIDWWIGEDGYPIPERDGIIRYCFMDGEDVSSIYWGDTREEVYKQCKHIIEKYYRKEYEQYGSPEELFIKSVAFIEGKLSDNVQLLRSDPTYLANLANQSEEQRARDLDGNWKYRSIGDDMIKLQHMENFYKNAYCSGDSVRRVSCDVAFDGGDAMVMWLWIGNHIQDLYVCRFNSKGAVNAVKTKLNEWHVREENFTYDLNGLGQAFKGFFPKSVPFNNRESVADEYKYIYANMKSQAAYMFAQAVINCDISISEDLLKRKISTRSFTDTPLTLVLNKERKAIRQNVTEADKGFSLIKKTEMKALVGHSPDFIEALLMRFVFDIKQKHHTKPRRLPRYVNPLGRFVKQ